MASSHKDLFWVGLSPRVRGNLVPPDGKQLVSGSIPACAGEPSSVSALR